MEDQRRYKWPLDWTAFPENFRGLRGDSSHRTEAQERAGREPGEWEPQPGEGRERGRGRHTGIPGPGNQQVHLSKYRLETPSYITLWTTKILICTENPLLFSLPFLFLPLPVMPIRCPEKTSPLPRLIAARCEVWLRKTGIFTQAKTEKCGRPRKDVWIHLVYSRLLRARHRIPTTTTRGQLYTPPLDTAINCLPEMTGWFMYFHPRLILGPQHHTI